MENTSDNLIPKLEDIRISEDDIKKHMPSDEQLLGHPFTKLDESYDNCVLLTGIPVVETAKAKSVLAYISAKMLKPLEAKDVHYSNIHLAFNDDKTMLAGYCFFEFQNENMAKKFALNINKIIAPTLAWKEVKAHFVSDMLRILDTPSEPEFPEQAPLTIPPYPYSYLDDEAGRAQYLAHTKVGENHQLNISWFDAIGKSQTLHTRDVAAFAKWAPSGASLVAAPGMGAVLSTGGVVYGENGAVLRFSEDHNLDAIVSNDNRFVVTRSASHVSIHDALLHGDGSQNGASRSVIKGGVIECNPNEIFKWSADSKFFFLFDPNNHKLRVYTIDIELGIVSTRFRTTIKATEAAWSPVGNRFAYFQPGTTNTPGKIAVFNPVTMADAISKSIICNRNLAIVWHPQGWYFAAANFIDGKSEPLSIEVIKTTGKFSGSGSTISFAAESFRAIGFEPYGTKVAIAIENLSNAKNISFYSLGDNNQTVCNATLLFKPSFVVSTLEWNPRGRFVCALTIAESGASKVWFFDAQNGDILNKTTSADYYEQANATSIAWDPSGRFVATFGNFCKHSYLKIWNHRGINLEHNNAASFVDFAWRPEPTNVLSEQDILHPNYRQYVAEFEEIDRERAETLSADANTVKNSRLLMWKHASEQFKQHEKFDDEYEYTIYSEEIISPPEVVK